MATELVRAEQLTLERQHKTVLDNISLSLSAGQILTLIGPNGCGKSTLVKVLLGLEKVDRGTVWRAPGLRIGYMPQRLQLDDRLPLTVGGFLALSRHAKPGDIEHWLERLNIRALQQQSVHRLSGGEWQRVLLARALLNRPQWLVLDEPVQGVDVQGQLELYELIPQLRDELGCAVVMVSHDLHLVMAATDEVVCLNGHVCCSGHPDQVSVDPAYLSLFGRQPAMAHYTHHHDHAHCLDGHVEPTRGGSV
ncbi:zinc ABC transporter ATP-binding protein ZnuC [Bacterioplanes sanyensis]|uniref:Zinc ABC transporter ATP-binding protein ZnuC n=1 Tax=Bacterioplanes sanyensis TaxID=1249553 RepID=A0A222FIJ4_9GAMM|nr:zinc ABC transporter ATP-binding protein ZnuC [Bacterioplanes sanyensis]ASP38043.1 zinc ABC transporter ATP-binding protein ZnuC [Bacterioplanes sanyensis]